MCCSEPWLSCASIKWSFATSAPLSVFLLLFLVFPSFPSPSTLVVVVESCWWWWWWGEPALIVLSFTNRVRRVVNEQHAIRHDREKKLSPTKTSQLRERPSSIHTKRAHPKGQSFVWIVSEISFSHEFAKLSRRDSLCSLFFLTVSVRNLDGVVIIIFVIWRTAHTLWS